MALGVSFLISRDFKAPWINPALLIGWAIAIFMVALGVFGKSLLATVFARATFQARIEYWTISLKVMRDNLLFGVGPDKLYDVSSLYMAPGSIKIITATRMDNAHNFYLNLGVNYGLISIVFLLALLVYVFLACLRNFKDLTTANAFSVAASVAFIAMFIDGLVSLEQPGLGIWLYLFAGMTVATAKSSFDSSNLNTDDKPRDSSKKSFTVKFVGGIAISAMVLGVLTIGNRVIIDGKLRKDVQSVLLNQGTKETLLSIESSAIRLASEPEYIIQALRPLAEIGDASKLNAISEASYNYYPLSIQASLIRADVLRALGRKTESCSFREALLLNMPWDLNQLESYVTCYTQGVRYRDFRKTLIFAEQYLPMIDLSSILPDSEEVTYLVARLENFSLYARIYFHLDKLQEAQEFQLYGRSLLIRLDELRQAGVPVPEIEQINLQKELLDF
jgi:hypothetical protein